MPQWDGGHRERVPVDEQGARDGRAVALDGPEAVAAARPHEAAGRADGEHVPAAAPHPPRPQRDRPVLGVLDDDVADTQHAAQVRRQLVGDLDRRRRDGAAGDERRVLDEGPVLVVREDVDEGGPPRRQSQVGQDGDVGVEGRTTGAHRPAGELHPVRRTGRP